MPSKASRSRACFLVVLMALGASACGERTAGDLDPPGERPASSGQWGAPKGALIRMRMNSTVGVLLDEIPQGPLREAAAAEALSRGPSFWHERAARQVRLTYYRLVYRSYFYDAKGPLPLPPDERWIVLPAGAPRRAQGGGHDAVVMDYLFLTYIVSDAASPGIVEPALGVVGGRWDEPFTLPLDPDMLFERTGYACMDEDSYPPSSVFEENTYFFYDDTCEAWMPGSLCHITGFPGESCHEALEARTGAVEAEMQFQRVPYNPLLASLMRVGARTSPDAAALEVMEDGMVREHRIVYRYFPPGSCEEDEGVIGQPGWRRLLMFSAAVRNNGGGPIHIGPVNDPADPWPASHVFEFSACHGHYHFSHYGNFGYSSAPGAKRAFCLMDTGRYHNNEQTSLVPIYGTCQYQGISPGWGDEYQFGIPGQWVDITGVDTTSPHDLTFELNPDHFLCEGVPVLGQGGAQLFEPTPFTDAAGEPVSRALCALTPGWQDDNHGAISVSSPGGSFVTEPCARGEIGPLRSCGLALEASLHGCTPGAPVALHCTSAGGPAVVRVCERSEALGVGVACTAGDAAATAVVPPGGADVTFTCPEVRDAPAPEVGGYSLYHGPLLSSGPPVQVTCTAN